MRGVNFYYEKFDEILRKADSEMANQFVDFRSNHNVRQIWLWLDSRVKSGQIPAEISSYLDDFYSEVW